LSIELMVVVFGILIAFSVDRWNQGRQDRHAEAAYLEALAQDLRADTAALSRLVGMYRDRKEAAQRIQQALEHQSPYPGDGAALAWDINNAGWITSFQPSDITYRELLGTGDLGLIRDPELKRQMVAYYQRVEFFAQFGPLWRQPALEYNPEVRGRVTPADWVAIERSRGAPEDEPVLIEEILPALRRDGVIHKHLTSVQSALEQQEASHEVLRADAARLLDTLFSRGN